MTVGIHEFPLWWWVSKYADHVGHLLGELDEISGWEAKAAELILAKDAAIAKFDMEIVPGMQQQIDGLKQHIESLHAIHQERVDGMMDRITGLELEVQRLNMELEATNV
jgi:hypothetical protein